MKQFQTVEKEKYLARYLAEYGKKLGAELIQQITGTEQTGQPLYLRSLLEEIRQYGDHFTLKNRIDEYLTALTTEQLLDKILLRYELDYQIERPHLVKDMLTAIWASREGLTEAELLDILGNKNAPLPRAILSPLFLAVRPFLGNRLGKITLPHGSMRNSVQKRYLNTKNIQDDIHIKLATYFSQRKPSSRSITEAPWHWMKAEKWESLTAELVDLSFLTDTWKVNSADVLIYWHAIESNSMIRMRDAYKFILQSPQKYLGAIPIVVDILIALDHLQMALQITKRQADSLRSQSNPIAYLEALIIHADLLREGGDLENAQRMYTKATLSSLLTCLEIKPEELKQTSYEEIKTAAINMANNRIQEYLEDPDNQLDMFDVYLKSLYGRALIEFNNANFSAATNLLTEGIVVISDELNKFSGSSAKIKNFFARHFMIFLAQHTTFSFITGGEENLLPMLTQSEELSRLFGDLPILATLLNNKGMLYQRQNRDMDALKQLKESQIILEKAGLIQALRANLRNQGLLAEKMGDPIQAAEAFEQSKSLARKTTKERFNIAGDQIKKYLILRFSCRAIAVILTVISIMALFTELIPALFSFLDGSAGKFTLALLFLLTGISLEASARWQARLDAAAQLKADSSAPSSIQEVKLRKQVIFNHQAKWMFTAWIFYAEMLFFLGWGVISSIGMVSVGNLFASNIGKGILILVLNSPQVIMSFDFRNRKRKQK